VPSYASRGRVRTRQARDAMTVPEAASLLGRGTAARSLYCSPNVALPAIVDPI
jgi:hypothetical protein